MCHSAVPHDMCMCELSFNYSVYNSLWFLNLRIHVFYQFWKIFTYFQTVGGGNGNPLQYSCLENPMDGGAWWATVHRVAKSQTRPSDFTFSLQTVLHFLYSHFLELQVYVRLYHIITHLKNIYFLFFTMFFCDTFCIIFQIFSPIS